ncbi:MAG: DNA-methyltransferase [Dehalococcoidia bacterium]
MKKPSLKIYFENNLKILKSMPANSVDLIYVDPPFNTGKKRSHSIMKNIQSDTGDRVGFQGKKYSTSTSNIYSYEDKIDSYLDFLRLRVEESKRILKKNGSFFLHLDFREIHYAKVLCDEIFGRDSFINEIIWSYDYGARSRKKWSAKHENILWYAIDPSNYTFRYHDIDRIPYMAPNLVGAEKAKKGKTPTDSWWHTIVSTNGKEKTGYPTQKPLGIIDRIIKVHSNPGDLVLDFFAGSGTTGMSAIKNDRNVVLIDNNPESINVMKKRFQEYDYKLI